MSDLQTAVLAGKFQLAKDLFETTGAQVDGTGKTLIHYAAIGTTKLCYRQNLTPFITLATLFIEGGVDVNAVDNEGNTALHLAVGESSPEFVYWLISKGANMSPNNAGETPISLAEASIKLKKSYKDDKKKLKRADGALYLAGRDGLFDFQVPEKFHCTGRFSLRTALMMALLAKLIYKGEGSDIGDTQSSGNALVRAVATRWGFSSVKIVEKNDARGMILEREETPEMPHLYCIAFRGTKTRKDVITDLTATKGGGGTTHAGFHTHLNRIAQTIIQEIPPGDGSPIYVTGHSLGGAMATLMMKQLQSVGFSPEQLHMYTFGQPRAGTKEFQEDFDATFIDAYLIQRNLDPVPLVPTFSGYVLGGYIHSGSLRYIDSAGQLYNDIHYQYEDINRGMMHSIPKDKKPSLEDLRKMWTGGFQQLIQVSVTEDETNIADLGFTETNAEADSSVRDGSSVPKKSSMQRDTNVVLNMLKGRKDALLAHGMLGYLTDIARLAARVSQPFSWEEPEHAITSQLTGVSLPLDVYDESIKGIRYKREQEAAYQHWVKYYTQVPGNAFLLDPSISCSHIIPWIRQDSTVLQQISEIEEAILLQYPYLEKRTEMPKSLHRKDVSPLVEVGMYSVINLLTQMMKENETLGMSYYRWLYWAMPEGGYSLKNSNSNKNEFLLEQEKSSPYRKGIQTSMFHLSNQSQESASLQQLAVTLPEIAQADNGPYIAKLSTNIQKMQKEWIKVRQEARVELSNLEFAIVGEMIAKFKKVGVKVGAFCAASGAVGAVTGTVAGVGTGVAVAAVTGGTATPAAIMAGVAVGAAVGSGTTGSIIGAAAAKKIPKYLESVKASIVGFEENLLGFADAQSEADREIHRAAILKICRNHQSRARVVLYMINGLYITLTLAKFQTDHPINPVTSGGKMVDKAPFIQRQLETFFRKVLSLINLYIAVVSIEEEKVNSHLQILEKLVYALETNVETFHDLFVVMGEELDVTRPTVGCDVYQKRTKIKLAMGKLNQMLTAQLNPGAAPPLQLGDEPDVPNLPTRPTAQWMPVNSTSQERLMDSNSNSNSNSHRHSPVIPAKPTDLFATPPSSSPTSPRFTSSLPPAPPQPPVEPISPRPPVPVSPVPGHVTGAELQKPLPPPPTSPRPAVPTSPLPPAPTSPRPAVPTSPLPTPPTSPRPAVPTSPLPAPPTSPRPTSSLPPVPPQTAECTISPRRPPVPVSPLPPVPGQVAGPESPKPLPPAPVLQPAGAPPIPNRSLKYSQELDTSDASDTSQKKLNTRKIFGSNKKTSSFFKKMTSKKSSA